MKSKPIESRFIKLNSNDASQSRAIISVDSLNEKNSKILSTKTNEYSTDQNQTMSEAGGLQKNPNLITFSPHQAVDSLNNKSQASDANDSLLIRHNNSFSSLEDKLLHLINQRKMSAKENKSDTILHSNVNSSSTKRLLKK